jgi:hypothetical protein
MQRTSPLAREAVLCAGGAACLAAVLAWLGPPGSDLAAHAYQRALFLQHGFVLWNNFWYAGRYSFVTYSLLYYPLAALLGIKLLAVATIATATLAFSFVIGREWGASARWSSRSFAVVWAGIVFSAAFPFALGAALALLALWALQSGARWRFAALATLTLLASPVAFLLLVVLLGGIALGRRAEWSRLVAPAAALGAVGVLELALWRAFPEGGTYPFSFAELAAAVAFCLLGAAATWRVEQARPLRGIFIVYLVACLAVYVVPSAVGENIARLRYAAVPLAVLALTLRGWRPRPVAIGILALAVSWNLTPLAASAAHHDPAAGAAYWQPAIGFLHAHLTPAYRVEAVDTTGHWPAVYLPKAGIPVARGWFRQDDFPQNRVLYDEFGSAAYLRWLRSLAVRYVVLADAPPDYSARGEAQLLAAGRSGLMPVFRTRHLTIYAVPSPRPLADGGASVLAFTQSRLVLEVRRAGTVRLAVRYSPYWRSSNGCVAHGSDGMTLLRVPRPGRVRLDFEVNAGGALEVLAGERPNGCG